VFISDFAIKRPLITVVSMVALVVFGLFSLWQLETDEVPDVQQPEPQAEPAVRAGEHAARPQHARRLREQRVLPPWRRHVVQHREAHDRVERAVRERQLGAIAGVSLLVGGYYFGREALEELVFEREIGIELLMAVAAVVAALMGQVAEGAMLAFLYSISEAAEGYTEEKTRSAVRALMDLAPKRALVRRAGREVEIPVEQVAVGDVFIVRPGEGVATDGAVKAGDSSVNQAPVTGECMLVEKTPGDVVYAGSINGEGALEIEATKAFAENTISRIIQMVEEA